MIGPDDPRHGTTRGYHAGCHDACCRAAMARYEKAGRLARLSGGRRVPAIGAQRRLQALMRLGWSSERIAQLAGVGHRNHVWRILAGQKGKPTTWLERATDEWVRKVYDELSMSIPPGPFVARTRMHAERRGWAPPLAWDDIDDPDQQPIYAFRDADTDPVDEDKDIDHAVVERVLAGDRIPSATTAERHEITRRWYRSGRSLRDLERATGWDQSRLWKALTVAAASAAERTITPSRHEGGEAA